MRVFASTFAEMLPEGFYAAACLIDTVDADTALCGVERSYVMSFSATRRREFAAGRFAARTALDLLGCPHVALPIGDGRAPVWPSGNVGSITHSAGVALAAVAYMGPEASLDIDIERCSALDDFLAKLIYANGDDRICDPTLLFSMKESAFKCVYSLHRRIIDFAEVAVRIDSGSGCFEVHPTSRATGPIAGVRGVYDRMHGFWRTACYLVDDVD